MRSRRPPAARPAWSRFVGPAAASRLFPTHPPKHTLAGSLTHSLTLPPTRTPGPYGVLPTDTTMAYIKENAQYMKRKLNSVPPVGA